MLINVDDIKPNQDLEVITRIKEMKLPVVLLGHGDVAGRIYTKLKNYGIHDIYFTVSNNSQGGDAEIDLKLEEYILIPAFHEAYLSEGNFDEFSKKRCVLRLGNIFEEENIDVEFYLKNQNKFEKVYVSLADEKSKKSLKAYLMAKLTDDISGFRSLIERPQYFSGGFFSMKSDEYLVDCGAYDGDSIRDFLHFTNNCYSYVYAFEPDGGNVKKLEKYICDNHLKNIEICPYGAYDEAAELHFDSGNGMRSRINETGSITIKTDTVDHILNGRKASFIKMDIEGSELKALIGAQNTIKKYQPILAISAYHKADDIFEIYETINRLKDGYKFYFRLHKAFAVDAVLYAVPIDRCIC